MLHSPALQQVLEQLLARYRLDPSERRLCLTQEGGDQLLIEELPENKCIRFSRYIAPAGRVPIKDLEIVFFVSPQGRWIPYEMYRDTPGRHTWGSVDGVKRTLTISDPLHQAALRDACDIWAFRLRDQAWLQHATKLDASGLVVEGPFLWPEPTVPQPDLETLEEWMVEDGGCEATDGCWLEVDGMCPHGHPAWLLRLGWV